MLTCRYYADSWLRQPSILRRLTGWEVQWIITSSNSGQLFGSERGSILVYINQLTRFMGFLGYLHRVGVGSITTVCFSRLCSSAEQIGCMSVLSLLLWKNTLKEFYLHFGD